MPTLGALAAFLDHYLRATEYPDDRNGLLDGADPDLAVRRLGLALAPAPDLAAWVAREGLDALLLHRAWGVESLALPPALGLLAYHLPFDDRLAVGRNPRLLDLLGVARAEPFAVRDDGRVLGAIGDVAPLSAATLAAALVDAFGGADEIVPPAEPVVRRLVLAGAMTDALVRDAAARGAGLYVTGQLRAPARAAVAETGIGVVAVGHERGERWGLRALAGLLGERWAGLTVVCHP